MASKNKDYIISIRGVIHAEKFRMHVSFLTGISDEEYKNYEIKLKSSRGFESKIEKEEIEKFLQYTKEKRKDKTELKDDIRILSYANEKDAIEIEYVYWKLWKYTKDFLWKVEEYRNSGDIIENFYSRIRCLNSSVRLETALEQIYVFQDDNDKILKDLKNLLVWYHPDKNSHEKARQIYEKVMLIYSTIQKILNEYRNYYGDTIFCNLKMFFHKELENIDKKSIREEINPVLRIEIINRYLEQEDLVAYIKDKTIEKYRELTKLADTILEMNIQKLKVGKKSDKKVIKKMWEQEREINKDINCLTERLKKEAIKWLSMCSPAKVKYNLEIDKQKTILNRTFDILEKYQTENRLIKLKDQLESLCKNERETTKFLTNTNTINLIRDNIRRLSFRKVLNSVEETKYDYISKYSELNKKYKNSIDSCMMKKFKKNDNCINNYIKRLLEKNRRKYDACFDENEYIRFNEVLSSLREENNKLCKKFKTEEEIENEYMNQLSVTRDMKKKSVNTREKEQQLREQIEIADAEIAEERKKRTEAEAKVQELLKLLSKTQEEEKIPISELSGIELEQIATLDTKNEPSFS